MQLHPHDPLPHDSNVWIATPEEVESCKEGQGVSATEETIELAVEHDIDPNNVEEIHCGVHYLIPETVFHENPQTGLQGKTSISYCV